MYHVTKMALSWKTYVYAGKSRNHCSKYVCLIYCDSTGIAGVGCGKLIQYIRNHPDTAKPVIHCSAAAGESSPSPTIYVTYLSTVRSLVLQYGENTSFRNANIISSSTRYKDDF